MRTAGAQAARPATSTPEVFSATAQAKNATGAVSGTLEIEVSRYTPDFDRKVVEEALRLGQGSGRAEARRDRTTARI